jgi:hypothetical protein
VRRGAVLSMAAAALCAMPGRALGAGESDGEQKPIRIQYSAHEGCPDALGFFWHVRARTQRVRLAEPGELAELATIHIDRDEGGSAGTLELPPMDGRPFSRRVEASTCGEVVLALSLVLALAYDPDAITTFPTVITAPSSQPPPTVAAPSEVLAQPPPPAPPKFGAAAGIAAYALGGIAPGLSSVLAPFIEYGSNADRLWKPRVMASLIFQIPAQEVRTLDGRSATLLFFGGQLTGCPIWASIAPGMTVAPCLGFDLGQIIGSGSEGVDSAQTGSLWWIAFEAIGRLRATLTGPVFAEFVGSGGVTLSHGEFVLQGPPEAHLYKVPNAFGSFGLGLGVHFQ